MQLSGKSTSLVYQSKYQHRLDSSGLCGHLSKRHNTVFLWQINTTILAPSPPSLHLVPATFSSPFLWENWSVRMELYQAADRVICPAPSLHHTFDTWIKNAASLFCFTVALVWRNMPHRAHMKLWVDKWELGVGWLPSLSLHRCPKKKRLNFPTHGFYYIDAVRFYRMSSHIM